MRPAARSLLRLGSALGLAATLLLVTVVPGASAPVPVATAWFDAPLAGSTHPLGPVAVTVHATDATGVDAIAVWVDDAELGRVAVDGSGPVLATADLTWTPATPGDHVLVARGIGLTGSLGAPASVVVTIAGDAASPGATASGTPAASPTQVTATPTAPPASSAPSTPPSTLPTPAPTKAPTSSPTPTTRPTPVPCSPAPPELLSPAGGVEIRDPALNPPMFRWAHRTPPACTPTGYRLQVFDDPDLGHVVLDVTLSAVLEWTPAAPLADCTTYFWRVATRAPGGTFGPWSAPASFELFIGRC